MSWQYILVFVGAMLVDILPFPLPPAFTVMIFLQIKFNLNIWSVIIIGVAGSVLGRYILTLYIPILSDKLLTRDKNEDVQFLGKKLKHKGWKSQAFIFLYSLMPLPTTPLFLASGMAKMKPLFIIPAFLLGKFISDSVAVLTGSYVAKNAGAMLEGLISWQSVTGLALGLVLVFVLFFIDWRTFLKSKNFKVKFNIWK